MKSYEVSINKTVTYRGAVLVQANSKEEAEQMAIDIIVRDDNVLTEDDFDISIEDIHCLLPTIDEIDLMLKHICKCINVNLPYDHDEILDFIYNDIDFNKLNNTHEEFFDSVALAFHSWITLRLLNNRLATK